MLDLTVLHGERNHVLDHRKYYILVLHVPLILYCLFGIMGITSHVGPTVHIVQNFAMALLCDFIRIYRYGSV